MRARARASALWCGELAANGREVARLTKGDVLRKGNHDKIFRYIFRFNSQIDGQRRAGHACGREGEREGGSLFPFKSDRRRSTSAPPNCRDVRSFVRPSYDPI